MSVLDLIRPDLVEMKTYTPIGDDLDCRLHANELPWTPLSLNNLALNYYPDRAEQNKLQAQIADYYQVKMEELLITRGSDDAIDFLMRFFLSARQDSFLQCPPTFPMYEFYARLQQVEVINCPLEEKNEFKISKEKLIALWRPNCKLIILCSPNNPTGTLIDLDTIARLCEQFKNKAALVIDEAYIDFSESPSASTLLSLFDNLIVLRTLSKAHGLAGLRLGAILAQPQLIKAMNNAIPPYTLPSAVINLAQLALKDKEWFSVKIKLILKERKLLIVELSKLSFIEKIYPSHGNFILIASVHAQNLAAWCREKGIAVRYFSVDPLQKMLRITVGNSDQSQRLLTAFTSFKP
ncbi:MAG: histidinol-phosphate transaminase [Tatlockia sp.]|nr:histidinol-phosphate transaminase [Tatlockia sp.]